MAEPLFRWGTVAGAAGTIGGKVDTCGAGFATVVSDGLTTV